MTGREVAATSSNPSACRGRMIGLPARHVAVHENTLARIKGILPMMFAEGFLSELDYESVMAAIDKDEATTQRALGVDLDAPEASA